MSHTPSCIRVPDTWKQDKIQEKAGGPVGWRGGSSLALQGHWTRLVTCSQHPFPSQKWAKEELGVGHWYPGHPDTQTPSFDAHVHSNTPWRRRRRRRRWSSREKSKPQHGKQSVEGDQNPAEHFRSGCLRSPLQSNSTRREAIQNLKDQLSALQLWAGQWLEQVMTCASGISGPSFSKGKCRMFDVSNILLSSGGSTDA